MIFKKNLIIYIVIITLLLLAINYFKETILDYIENNNKHTYLTIEYKDKNLLKEGDIILVENNAIVSNILQKVDKDFPYTHTGVIVNYEGRLVVLNIDAKKFFEKGSINLIEIEGFIEEAKDLSIYRLKNNFNLELFRESIDNIIQYRNNYYFDWFASLNNNSYYCVELLRKIFLKQNINITKTAKIKRNNMEMYFPSDIDFEKFDLILKEKNVDNL